jgi:hypothetical protein
MLGNTVQARIKSEQPQVDKVRTRSSHMEREAIFEREARSRAVSECSWLRDKLSTLYEKVSFFSFALGPCRHYHLSAADGFFWRQTDHLNKVEVERRNERADLIRNLKVRESEIESMMQTMQGLAQDMWLRLESEAKLMWGGLNEYRAALEQSSRTSDESRIHGHEEVNFFFCGGGGVRIITRGVKMLTFACICGAVDERLSVSGAAVTRV